MHPGEVVSSARRAAYLIAALALCVAAGSCRPRPITPAAENLDAVPTEIPATRQPTAPSTGTSTSTPKRSATTTDAPTPVSTTTETLTQTPTPTATPTSSPSPLPTATRTRTPAYRLNPQGSVGLGVYVDGTPYDEFVTAGGFESLIRHKLEYVLWFQAWGESDKAFFTDLVKLAARNGFVPVITWEPWKRNFANPVELQPSYSFSSIASGEHDLYIQSWARAARAVDVPIVLRFAHEQSTRPGTRQWYPWQGDPEGYRAAYRHIVEIFRREGAKKVQFLWSAMWLNEWASQYYPGEDVVDLVGTTVLNHGTAAQADWAKWRTFDDLFSGQYAAALQWGKPIMVTELATAEQGGDKASWLKDCLSSLRTKYPLVRSLLLFEVQSDREWPEINWSVASSPRSRATFQEAIRDPYFR